MPDPETDLPAAAGLTLTPGDFTLSPDGEYAVFTAMTTGPANNPSTQSIQNLYIEDLSTGAVTLVTQGFDGSAANGGSGAVTFAGDGTEILFASVATNLVNTDLGYTAATIPQAVYPPPISAADEGDSFSGLYAFNISTGQTTLVDDPDVVDFYKGGGSDIAQAGIIENVTSSANGTEAAYLYNYIEAVPNGSTGGFAIDDYINLYVRDLTNETTDYSVPLEYSGEIPQTLSLSADGQWLAYESSGNSARQVDVYLHNNITNQTTLVSQFGGVPASQLAPVNGYESGAFAATLSADGSTL